MNQHRTFGEALALLEQGKGASRDDWEGMWLRLQVPDAHSKMTRPYIFLATVQGDLVPWTASQADLLAKDWGEVAP